MGMLTYPQLFIVAFVPLRTGVWIFENIEEHHNYGQRFIPILGLKLRRISICFVAVALYALLSCIFASTTFHRLEPAITHGTQCNIPLGGDVDGLGIRMASWMQVISLCLVYGAGLFTNYPIGAQELGGALLLTHGGFSLLAFVLVPGRSLTPVDAIFAAMILDAQNAALGIQLSCKDVFAKRWQVWMAVAGMVTGLITVGFLVTQVRQVLSSESIIYSVLNFGSAGYRRVTLSNRISVLQCHLVG